MDKGPHLQGEAKEPKARVRSAKDLGWSYEAILLRFTQVKYLVDFLHREALQTSQRLGPLSGYWSRLARF